MDDRDMETARAVLKQYDADKFLDGYGGLKRAPLDMLLDAIAAALRATRAEERERCAKIAEDARDLSLRLVAENAKYRIKDTFAAYSVAEAQIAAAIRNPTGGEAVGYCGLAGQS